MKLFESQSTASSRDFVGSNTSTGYSTGRMGAASGDAIPFYPSLVENLMTDDV